ncbi:MAG: exosortase/archaeosortase family protein [bacterium]|nr:MAG: exosortase/archaeosortase family protein [bacterium]
MHATSEPASKRMGMGRMILPLALGAAFIALYIPVLVPLFRQWLNDPNYHHGLLVPVIAGFLLYKQRERLKELREGNGAVAGIICVASAAVLLIGGTAASELFTSRVSIPLLLIGASLFLRGVRFTKVAAFPLLFLFLMIPLPYIIYYKITFPMQLMSAKISTRVLHILQVNVIRKGNILHLPNYSLEVVAACSGLRSLMTMFVLALILAALSGISTTRKVILVALAVPAAIAANTIRLVVTAVGAYTSGPALAEGILHEISGLIVFFVGFMLLMIAALLLRLKR